MTAQAERRHYWTGNSAKSKVIGEVLDAAQAQPERQLLVFDYGCGSGGDWPSILPDYPNLRLIGYDPIVREIEIARTRLKGLPAQMLTGAELAEKDFRAEYILSFSVFEHVYDRRAYLQTAHRHLAENGRFYLNYDDGHFRSLLDLSAPGTWPVTIRVWLHNLLARPLARLGWVSQFQARVDRVEVDRLIEEAGFTIERAFYSNLTSLKSITKGLSAEKREAFARMWIALEEQLNAEFLEEGAVILGDSANLWQQMGSRTCVLRV